MKMLVSLTSQVFCTLFSIRYSLWLWYILYPGRRRWPPLETGAFSWPPTGSWLMSTTRTSTTLTPATFTSTCVRRALCRRSWHSSGAARCHSAAETAHTPSCRMSRSPPHSRCVWCGEDLAGMCGSKTLTRVSVFMAFVLCVTSEAWSLLHFCSLWIIV